MLPFFKLASHGTNLGPTFDFHGVLHSPQRISLRMLRVSLRLRAMQTPASFAERHRCYLCFAAMLHDKHIPQDAGRAGLVHASLRVPRLFLLATFTLTVGLLDISPGIKEKKKS